MKMTPEHYRRLEGMLDAVATDYAVGHLRAIAESDPRTKDVRKRLRWDLLWSIPSGVRRPWFGEVYTYCDDTHIDTALRHYMKDRGH